MPESSRFRNAFHYIWHMSNEKKPWLVGLYRGIILPSFMGILISQYKDPYKPTSIMESRRVFFVAHMFVKMSCFLVNWSKLTSAYSSIGLVQSPIRFLLCFFSLWTQLVVHCWFGARYERDSFLGVPLFNHQSTNQNQQLTICWGISRVN